MEYKTVMRRVPAERCPLDNIRELDIGFYSSDAGGGDGSAIPLFLSRSLAGIKSVTMNPGRYLELLVLRDRHIRATGICINQDRNKIYYVEEGKPLPLPRECWTEEFTVTAVNLDDSIPYVMNVADVESRICLTTSARPFGAGSLPSRTCPKFLLPSRDSISSDSWDVLHEIPCAGYRSARVKVTTTESDDRTAIVRAVAIDSQGNRSLVSAKILSSLNGVTTSMGVDLRCNLPDNVAKLEVSCCEIGSLTGMTHDGGSVTLGIERYDKDMAVAEITRTGVVPYVQIPASVYAPAQRQVACSSYVGVALGKMWSDTNSHIYGLYGTQVSADEDVIPLPARSLLKITTTNETDTVVANAQACNAILVLFYAGSASGDNDGRFYLESGL